MARVSVFPTIGGASAARCSGHPIPMGLSRPLHRVLPTIFCVSILSDICNTAGVPQVHYFGQEGLHNVLVIDLLGPNLEDLFDMCGRKFTIKTVCMAAKQMVSDSTLCVLLIASSVAFVAADSSTKTAGWNNDQAQPCNYAPRQ